MSVILGYKFFYLVYVLRTFPTKYHRSVDGDQNVILNSDSDALVLFGQ